MKINEEQNVDLERKPNELFFSLSLENSVSFLLKSLWFVFLGFSFPLHVQLPSPQSLRNCLSHFGLSFLFLALTLLRCFNFPTCLTHVKFVVNREEMERRTLK